MENNPLSETFWHGSWTSDHPRNTARGCVILHVGGFRLPSADLQYPVSRGGTASIGSPNLTILGSAFVTDPVTGNVTAVNANVTTTGPSSAMQFYRITAQLSCSTSSGSTFQCDAGTADTILPGNMMSSTPPAATLITIMLTQRISPGGPAQIDAISFNVQGIQDPRGIALACASIPPFSFEKSTPRPPPDVPDLPIAAGYSTSFVRPAFPGENFVSVLKVRSNCGFSGIGNITANVGPAGPTGSLCNHPPENQPLSCSPFGQIFNGLSMPAGGSVFGFEFIHIPPTAPAFAAYTVTLIACFGTTCQNIVQVFNITLRS